MMIGDWSKMSRCKAGRRDATQTYFIGTSRSDRVGQRRRWAFFTSPIMIGLTGGVATGKSTVAKMFRRLGAVTIDTDGIAHEVICKNTIEYKKIVRLFGEEILKKTGEIDRKRLAKKIFGSGREGDGLRKKLEKIVHPAVWRNVENKIKLHKKAKVVVIEVPLLFEAGWDKKTDLNIVVTCRREQQESRCKKEFIDRIDSQLSLKQKVKKADLVIDNSKTLKETETLVKIVWQNFL